MKNNLTRQWPELLLCAVTAYALSRIAFAGFDSPDARVGSAPLIAMAVAVFTLLLFMLGQNRMGIMAGMFTLAVVLLILLLRPGAAAGETGQRLDESPGLFYLVTAVSAALACLLSRSRAGCCILLLFTILVSAAFGFLAYPLEERWFVISLLSETILLLQRIYGAFLLQAVTGTPAKGRYGLQCAGLCLLSILLSVGLYLGLVQNRAEAREELKLITTLKSLQVVEKMGISRKTEVKTDDLTTLELNDLTESAPELPPELPETQEAEPEMPEEPEDAEEDTRQLQEMQAISYEEKPSLRYLRRALLVLLVLLAPPCARLSFRRRWERRQLLAGPTRGSAALYEYMISALRYAGFVRAEGVTLREFVSMHKDALSDFAVGEWDLVSLNAWYERICYGGCELSEEQARPFWEVYEAFRGNLRRKTGLWTYARHFFAL